MKKKIILAFVSAFLIAVGLPSLAPATIHGQAPLRVEAPDRDSEGSALEEIEKKVKELIGELEKLRRDASQKLRKDVIPFLEKEIDRLKKWLHDLRLNEKREPQTRKT